MQKGLRHPILEHKGDQQNLSWLPQLPFERPFRITVLCILRKETCGCGCFQWKCFSNKHKAHFNIASKVQQYSIDLKITQRNQRSNCQHLLDHRKSKSSIKISISALLTMPKLLTVWITKNWKILKEIGIPDHPTCLFKICMQVRKQHRTGHGTTH